MNIVMIAEKPSVARTYAQALDLKDKNKTESYIEGTSCWDGHHYFITWSFGHLVTMSYPAVYDEKYKKWNFDDLPFLPEQYKYEVIKDSAKQYKAVKELYHRNDIDQIIYAGDSGREGLYIQCLIRMLAGNNGHVTEKVLWIDSQTTEEIRKGLSAMKPLSAYSNYQNAGYMRAIEDYAFGINYSRMFSCKFGYEFNEKVKSEKWKPISIGRVMTCVLGMVVNREREIKNFVPTTFYKIFANCNNGEFDFSADWYVGKGTKYYDSDLLYDNKGFLKLSDANTFLAELNASPELVVDSIEDKTEKKKAPLLFNLAELQNECSKRFKISPNQTLEIAQKLYEAKLTTYPRTDARYLSTAICAVIEDNLEGLKKMGYHSDFAGRILTFSMHAGIEKTQYCNDSKITDHYAIIPTGEGSTKDLTPVEEKVYHMIVDRFLCIFMPQAEYNISTAFLKAANGELFRISEKALIKRGYLEILQDVSAEDKGDEETEDIGDVKLSDYLKKGDKYHAEFFSEEGQTTPPKRYTSGSMILAMENAGNLIEDEELRAQIKGSGIGTAATRAGILEKLDKLGYININKKTQTISPHVDGEAVYDIVYKIIPEFLSPKMTASWEKGLAQIEDGVTTKEYYMNILEAEIKKTYDKLKGIETKGRPERVDDGFVSENTGFKCPFCGSSIVTTRNGYKCAEYKYKEKKSCPFCVSRQITKEELSSLLSGEQIGPFEFNKKSGDGTFKAFYVLNKENKSIDLAFENSGESSGERFTSEKTGLSCPFCGSDVVTSAKGFRCIKYKYKDKNACGFSVSGFGGVEFTHDDVAKLCSEGKMGPFTFQKKSGAGTYDACMVANKKKNSVDLEFQPNE